MGRGDKKSKKGKIFKGSFGISRNKKATKAKLKRTASKSASTASAPAAAKPKKTARKKAEA